MVKKKCSTYHSVAEADSNSGFWIIIYSSAVKTAKFMARMFLPSCVLAHVSYLHKQRERIVVQSIQKYVRT